MMLNIAPGSKPTVLVGLLLKLASTTSVETTLAALPVVIETGDAQVPALMVGVPIEVEPVATVIGMLAGRLYGKLRAVIG
jgi:hypothetical protein